MTDKKYKGRVVGEAGQRANGGQMTVPSLPMARSTAAILASDYFLHRPSTSFFCMLFSLLEMLRQLFVQMVPHQNGLL